MWRRPGERVTFNGKVWIIEEVCMKYAQAPKYLLKKGNETLKVSEEEIRNQERV